MQTTEVPALPRIPTGRDAIRSLQDRLARHRKKAYADPVWPVDARRDRRFQQAADARQRRKDNRRYKRRELAKEREAGDLANLFRIVDGPTTPFTARAQEAISRRVDFIVDQRLRADSEYSADRPGIITELRKIASAA